MIYNHYAVLQGLSTPYTKAMANLARPEQGGDADFFGCGTLAYTLDATASPYPAYPIPVAPTGLTANAGIAWVTLNWTAPGGDVAQGYKVMRSTTSGGPYTTVASWNDNTSTQYTDGNLTNGTKYYYVVSAINQSGTGGNSTEVSCTPVAASISLPTGWASKDIGTVNPADSVVYANNIFVTTGVGYSGTGGTSDGVRYIYGSVTGDATMTARLVSGGWGRQGIMIRESLDPASKAMIMTLGDPTPRFAAFGTRAIAGAAMFWTDADAFSAGPVGFRLERSGNKFVAYESGDGVTWQVVGSTIVTMNSTYYVGMFTASTTSTFDNVTVVGGGSAPPAPKSLTGTALTSSRIKLLWTASSSGTSGYIVKRSLTNGGPYSTVATVITDTSYVDSGLVASTNYYYVVKSASIVGESA
jgi:hypothetical protein